MDLYGIGNAIKTAFRMYQQSARQTGRTTSMLEALKSGDRVVCLNARDARWLQERAKEYGLAEVTFAVSSVEDQSVLWQIGTPQGRLVFDHQWVEAYYERMIEQAEKHLDHMQRELSGFGTAHIETRLKARETQRWRL